MLTHINYAYVLLQTLLEGVSVYRGVWLKSTRQLAWYTLFEITESRFALMFDPRYMMSLQVIDYSRYSKLEIFQYRNTAAVTRKSPLLNVLKTHPCTLIIETLQQSTQTREGDRLKLLPNEILGEISSQLSKRDLLDCQFLGRHYQVVIESLPLYKDI